MSTVQVHPRVFAQHPELDEADAAATWKGAAASQNLPRTWD